MKSAILFLTLVVLASGVVRAQPQKGYDVHYYNATVKLDRATDSLWGQVTMMATADSTISQILQYRKYLTLDSVFVNNVLAGFQITDTGSGAYVVLPSSAIQSGSQFQILTYYHGKGTEEQNSIAWGGVHDYDTMMFAMGVGFQAPYTGCTRHWLPCYDLPDDKADSVDLTFITSPTDITASNGVLVSNELTPQAERKMHWHESDPIATYLLTFATGPYTVQKIPNTLGLPFEVYALMSDSAKAAAEMNIRVSPILAFYDSLFAPYPFQKVGYVITPIGSMEHQTMICLDRGVIGGNPATDTTGNSTTAIHELSHQWWGDRVTCKTFNDAWLNEGFANYCESLSLEHLYGREKYISRQHQNIAAAKGSNLPMFGAATVDNHSNNYPTSTIYQKGASVLGMLRQYLGDSIFFTAMRYYGNTHAYSTVTSYDLWNDFEAIAKQDLGWFFKPWVFGTGYPKDTIFWNVQPSGASITFHQMRNNDSTIYFRLAVPVKGSTKSGLVKTDTVWMDSTQISIVTATFGFKPDTVIFDPDGLLLWRIVQSIEMSADIAPVPLQQSDLTLHVFPNPDRKQMLTIELQGPQILGKITLQISDASGKIVKSESFSANSSSIDHATSIQGLASGQYLVVARSQYGQVSQRFSITP